MKLVLNSYRFWRDIVPEVLRSLPPKQDTPTSAEPGIQGNPLLLEAIISARHVIIITLGIQEQYIREAASEGYDSSQMLLITQQLEEHRAIIRPRIPGGNRNIRGIRKRHRPLFDDAIAAAADYFITENPVWLRLTDRLLREHSLRIITPGGFINREGIL